MGDIHLGRHDAFVDFDTASHEYRLVFPWLTGRCSPPYIRIGHTNIDTIDALTVAKKIAWDTRNELQLLEWLRQFVLMRERARDEERPAYDM